MPPRRSGLQRDVTSLYRQYLRMVMQKPTDTRAAWYQFVTHEFRKHGDVRARDVGTIEYLLRRARNSLERYEDRSTRSVAVPYGVEYPTGWLVNAAPASLRSRRNGGGANGQ